jgi:hypothetical protein
MDNLVVVLVVAFFILMPLITTVRGVKRGYDRLVEQQKGQTAPDRVSKIEAMMAARGITPPPALQAAVEAYAAAAQPARPPGAVAAYQAAPAYQAPQAPPPPAQRQPVQQRPPQPAANAVRRAVPAARSVDVPIVPGAADGSMRRTLATAFGDPAHARNAVVLAEVLGSPVALR